MTARFLLGWLLGLLGLCWPVATFGQTERPGPPAPQWHEYLKLGAFADAYYSYNFDQPHPEGGSNVGLGGPGGNLLRAYDFNNGLSLHWAGVDAS